MARTKPVLTPEAAPLDSGQLHPGRPHPGPLPGFAPPTTAEVYRATDGLHAVVRFVPAGPTGLPPRLVVELDPQHLGEETVAEELADSLPSSTQLAGQPSGPSRLAFDLPPNAGNPLGGSLAAVLGLIGTLPLRLPPQAVEPQPLILLREPTPEETALELPWRLVLAPADPELAWTHPTDPVVLAGRATLWWTRLIPPTRNGPIPMRAVWSDDYPLVSTDPIAQTPLADRITPLTADERATLVVLTSEAGGMVEGQPYPAPAISPELVALTPIGGKLNVHARFQKVARAGSTDGALTSLVAWSHRVELGRDMRVEVVHAGRLAPFGHAATIVRISERSVHSGRALLDRRMFLTVTEPVKVYSAAAQTVDGRAFPFREVEILTRVVAFDAKVDVHTPIVLNYGALGAGNPHTGQTVLFDVRLTDRHGHQMRTRLPLVWAASEVVGSALASWYVEHLHPAARTGDLDGAKVVLYEVDQTSESPNAVHRIQFEARDVATDDQAVIPHVTQLEVEVPGSAEFGGARQLTQMVWSDQYLDQGLQGSVRAYLTRAKKDIVVDGAEPVAAELFGHQAAATTTAAGGLLTPTLVVQGFAHELGVIAGAGKTMADASAAVALATGTGDVEQLSKVLPAMKLLGVLELGQLMRPADFAGGLGLPQLKRVPNGDGSVDTVLALTITGALPPTAGTAGDQSGDVVVGIFRFHRRDDFELSIQARARTGAANTVTASMQNFDVGFDLGALGSKLWIQFRRLAFLTTGGKPDFQLSFADDAVRVDGGPLEFVVRLLQLVPPEAFADPPDVQIPPTGVTAGYSLALPPIQLGAFSLSNLSFGAGFSLPFLGERPALRLALASRDNPFGLIIAILGGAGFVAIEVDTAGLRQIEISLEAQAGVALNLGVAKGKVLARLGIYFRLTLTNGTTDIALEGFVEVSGAVCVISIITVSITANLTLGYDISSKKVSGRATVSVGVKVLFVKKTVKFAIERSFSRDGGDPSFHDVFDAARFATYCGAFA